MKSKHRIASIFVGMVLLTMCGAFALAFYFFTHQGELVPRWVSLSFLCFIVLVYAVGFTMIRRDARKLAGEETPEEGERRRARAIKGLKIGLVIYLFGLLNGIRLVIQREIPWRLSIAGFTISIFLIATMWASLRRLRRSQQDKQSATQQEPQP
jgi:Na+/melibiose symporter-like transporter